MHYLQKLLMKTFTMKTKSSKYRDINVKNAYQNIVKTTIKKIALVVSF